MSDKTVPIEDLNNILDNLKSDISVKNMEDLVEALAASDPAQLAKAPRNNLIVEKIKDTSYLTEESNTVLANMINLLDIVKDNTVTAKALYLSTRVKESEKDLGIKIISNEINKLIAKGYAKSVLTPLVSFELFTYSEKEPQILIACFPHVDIDHYDEVNTSPYAHQEGGIGPKEGSLKE